ncbi:MAG: hypothetical protein Q8Q46_03870 [Candidatus Giovannonibacteria bacterium]|nr:hypothetical protein [Candidatus Giovannonibacteria bacterium]
MRLFFINWSGKKLGMMDVVKKIKENHTVLYLTSTDLSNINKSDFPDTILHDHSEALNGIRAEKLAGENFAPPGEGLLKKMYETESIVLTMMNKHFEEKTVSERKFLYLKYVGYWDAVLQRYRPDAIVFPTTPHTVYDFVIYALAKIYNIKTVMMEPLWIGDRMISMNDYIEGPKIFLDTAEPFLGREAALNGISRDLREEYVSQHDKNKDTAPVMFVKSVKRKYSGVVGLKIKIRSFWTTITVLGDFSVFAKIITYFPRRLRPNQRMEYMSLAAPPDFDKKFVYFPLHYQPERNSSPQGGVFVDQILMAETLSASLPEDWLLYIKEHPTQWLYRGPDYFSYRFMGYYRALAKLKNVRILPLETSARDLTERSEAVATITGTAGWEAILRRKPALIFGYPWYRHAPGVFRIWGVDSCRSALEKIKNGFSFSEEDIIKYLQVLDKATFHGYIDLYGQQVSKLSPKENSINIASEILKQL